MTYPYDESLDRAVRPDGSPLELDDFPADCIADAAFAAHHLRQRLGGTHLLVRPNTRIARGLFVLRLAGAIGLAATPRSDGLVHVEVWRGILQ